MKVYTAINAVQAELCKEGITKDRKNQMQGFMFRGIDDVYNAISPIMAKYGLCILPRYIKREITERMSKKGDALFYVCVEGEFDFVCAEDGSKHTIRTFGEAMDIGDKATNKAMSAAYKYAAFQAFAIPTEGDNDADASTPPPISPKNEKSTRSLDVLKDMLKSVELSTWSEFVKNAANFKAQLTDSDLKKYESEAKKRYGELKALHSESMQAAMLGIDNVRHFENWLDKHSSELTTELKVFADARLETLKKEFQKKIEPAKEPVIEG